MHAAFDAKGCHSQPSASPQQAMSAPRAPSRMEMQESGQVPRPGTLIGGRPCARTLSAGAVSATARRRSRAILYKGDDELLVGWTSESNKRMTREWSWMGALLIHFLPNLIGIDQCNVQEIDLHSSEAV